MRDMEAAEREVALLVLAEVLNNVAEHAYHGRPGPVAVALWRMRGALRVQVLDRGVKAPRLCDMPPHDPMAMPEGGFGIGLIRTLARKVEQKHRFGCNVLCFRLIGDNPQS